MFIYSGEFHPFRLPVSDLYLDVFQKIKALGFNAVSFYVNWALLEGEPGVYNASGIFALEPFFDAAQEAGLWLIARPGPVSHSYFEALRYAHLATVHQFRIVWRRLSWLVATHSWRIEDTRSELPRLHGQLPRPYHSHYSQGTNH